MWVVPGGLTPYLQAGDIGIYKVFKDKLSSVLGEWKRSDNVEYPPRGNPRPPSVETVCNWQQWGRDENSETQDPFNVDELEEALDDIEIVEQ
ncbi:hypothetical protein PPTG_05128 [Phytophthora nicotianae INRA-310]|uniref:Uncharacterized protein n=1 Tax=Phytophthora nicotianae (strain INRA-310) TaxID=761204 RepID=W2QXZ7_PHYN3|nr:hypothetical protein PPTG_05128 [Phytophthora nicotianae INRA-310]ETN17294.1 hypothetical protein PPTG_05128 [Phytophthora nicotianae INRA-310]